MDLLIYEQPELRFVVPCAVCGLHLNLDLLLNATAERPSLILCEVADETKLEFPEIAITSHADPVNWQR
jgi:hypothetical protein